MKLPAGVQTIKNCPNYAAHSVVASRAAICENNVSMGMSLARVGELC